MTNYKTIKSILDREFVKTEQMARVLATGFRHDMNIMLVGPGGHGKSLMLEKVIEGLGLADNAITIECHGDLMVEDLWGGIDLKYARETGRQRYLLENCVADHEIVILEEGGDLNMGTALALKQPLQAGYIWNAGVKVPLKTRLVIMTSNISREELAVNDAIQALMERFPLELEVRWSAYTAMDFMELFQKRFGQRIPALASFVAEAIEQGAIISPRTAQHMAKVYLAAPEDTIYVAGLPEAFRKDFKKRLLEAERKWKGKIEVLEWLKQLEREVPVLLGRADEMDTWSDLQTAKGEQEETLKVIEEIQGSGIKLDKDTFGKLSMFKRLLGKATRKVEARLQEENG